MLTIESLTLGYPGKPPVITNCSFDAHEGEFLALIGPNGSGKTTLIRGITSVLPLLSGRICFREQDLAALSIRERARLVSIVPQVNRIPTGLTVREVVSLGRAPYLNRFGKLTHEDQDRIGEAITLTELESFANKEAANLSGGEQQRIVLARALAQNTPVLILDEPTVYLDLYYQIHLLELVREIMERRSLTVIATLHDLNQAARYADRIALLSEGKITHIGSPRETLQTEILSEIYRIPLRVIHEGDGEIFILP